MDRIRIFVQNTFRLNSEWIDRIGQGKVEWRLVLASALCLFFELSLIRWHAATFQLFSFYKNISLLSCFLGLGIGFALAGRRPILTGWVIPGVLLQWVLFSLVATYLPELTERNPIVEDQTMGFGPAQDLGLRALIFGLVGLVYALAAINSVPLGQLTGALMARLPTLRAYGLNLGGSMLGIAAFFLLSHLWTGPVVWWALVTAALLPFVHRPAPLRWITAATGAALCACIAFLGIAEGRMIFSPYQGIEIQEHPEENPPVVLRISQFYYQQILDLSPARRRASPELRRFGAYYDAPYAARPRPGRVLIVGAGTGNDVDAALRAGAARVDAVEIDPAILEIGRRLHPARPYDDPRVRIHVDDARAYVRNTRERYDLVVYGLLDSHTALSSLSSVRQDSFVYTVEAFHEVRERLSPDGILALTFAVTDRSIGKKLFLMLKQAFDGKDPLVLGSSGDPGLIFLTGPGVGAIRPQSLPFEDFTARVAGAPVQVDLSTDDWPFFYLPRRGFPASYLLTVLLLTAVSLPLIRGFLRPDRAGSEPLVSRAVFFFLGAGFMLVETRAITELGLQLGNTWIVVALVIFGILTMAFIANLLVAALPRLPDAPAFALLLLSLALGWTARMDWFAGLPSWGAQALAVALVSVPVLFAGIIFSNRLRAAGSVGAAMSSNLFGSICGGLLEYCSMMTGIRGLYLVAMAMYGLAFISYLRVTPTSTGRP